jgi:two-component system chemotaxis sensor kinase CheA
LQQVVVFHDVEHVVGLVVEEIVDVIEDNLEQNSAFEDSDHKSIVLNGKAMDLIDVSLIFYKTVYGQKAYDDLLQARNDAQAALVKEAKLKNKSSKDLKNEINNSNSSKKIAYVDDSMFFRKVMPIYLADEGFQVQAFSSATAALNTLKEQSDQYKLIVTDINMPVMNGYTLLEKLKLAHIENSLPFIPVICISSDEISNDRDFKFDDILTVPVEISSLKRAVERWFT